MNCVQASVVEDDDSDDKLLYVFNDDSNPSDEYGFLIQVACLI